MKMPGFIFSFEMIIVLFVISSFSVGGVYLGGKAIQNYRMDQLEMECNMIDNALETYAQSHRSVITGSTRQSATTGKVYYEQGRLYPEKLDELWDLGYVSPQVNHNKFTYQSWTKSDGSMSYSLTAKAPNGSTYASKQSNR